MNICVFGAARDEIAGEFFDLGEALGEAMGRRGHTMVFGGGAHGLMGAAARGCKAGGGRIVGVAPSFFNVDGVLYPHCDEFVYTETMRQRKQILEERADAFVAVPGGIGTFDEFFEILTLKQLGRHGKAIALFNAEDYYVPLLALLESSIEKGFLSPNSRALWADFREPAALLDYLEAYVPRVPDIAEMKNIGGK